MLQPTGERPSRFAKKLFAGAAISGVWGSRRAEEAVRGLLPQRGMQKMNNGNIVELKNITVAFDGETVLDDLSLAIRLSPF